MLAKIFQFVNPFGKLRIDAELRRSIKKYQNDIILVIGVILVSLLSFAAGYIVAKQQEKTPIRFEKTNEQRTMSNEQNNSRDKIMFAVRCSLFTDL